MFHDARYRNHLLHFRNLLSFSYLHRKVKNPPIFYRFYFNPYQSFYLRAFRDYRKRFLSGRHYLDKI